MTSDLLDLRSDTVTRPTDGMRAAMAAAEVGDDVYGEDPTVIALERRVAGLFGKPAALFTPTGSLANLLALAAVVRPGEEFLCEARAHVVRAELGAHSAVSGVTSRTWRNKRGQIDIEAIREMYAPDLGPFFVRTAAISVENTHNFAGGAVLPIADLRATRALADELGCAVHIDGARIWNAHIATGTSLADYGAIADVMAVCLSKGLGAPVGSLVLGSHEAISEARVRRKRLGAGMRQVGILAAAGLYALDHHLDRLAEDHANARTIAELCGLDPNDVDTNIVVIEVEDAPAVVGRAKEAGVLIGAVGPRTLRVLTHLGVDDADAQRAGEVLRPLVTPR